MSSLPPTAGVASGRGNQHLKDEDRELLIVLLICQLQAIRMHHLHELQLSELPGLVGVHHHHQLGPGGQIDIPHRDSSRMNT